MARHGRQTSQGNCTCEMGSKCHGLFCDGEGYMQGVGGIF